jgi:DNA-binding MarR family transcriptional regulator
MTPRRRPTTAQLNDLQGCFCLGLRRATRIVTQRYDAALRPFGIRATQLPILTAAASGAGVPLTPLAERLGMERTTLLRNLRPLLRRGLVDVRRAAGHRHDELFGTAKGRGLLARAYPAWRGVQDEVRTRLSAPAWQRTLRDLGQRVRPHERG